MGETSLEDRVALQFEVEQFLYEEAALLDARQYREWLDLLTDDIVYWMPIRRTVMLADIDQEFTKRGAMAYFDDDRESLELRVKKMESASSWSEDPPSRTRHMLTNVRILEVNGDDHMVEAFFHIYRSRLDTEVNSWVGRRIDVIRRTASGWKLAKRDIYLDQTLIRATNMSILF
ncbi:MAG: 3-phenylpropionate/cinnamic acid dioxygenase subunit beta [Parvibaculaceae bacterium]